jgi:hypothetical protein
LGFGLVLLSCDFVFLILLLAQALAAFGAAIPKTTKQAH